MTTKVKRPQGITKATLTQAQRDERKALKVAKATDSFNNFSINLGLGTNNALSGGTYGFNPITRVRTLLEWMYRGSWLARVGIDQVAMDMTRGGVNLLTDAKAADVAKLENRMSRLRVWPAMNDAIKWSRLYGGCLAYIQITGADPSTPLRPEAVGKKSFLGLQVLDRWMVEPMLNQLVPEGPDVGLPMFYRVVGDAPGLKGLLVHYSRCVRLVGVKLPYWQQVMENYWGVSIFEPLYDRMVAFDSATMGAAQLAYKAHLRTMSIKGYRQILSAGGVLTQGLAKQLELVRQFQSIEGMTIIDAEDKLETQTAQFSGLSDVILQLAQQLSGGLKMPLTKVLGQSAAGLNATGEGDERNYNSTIKQEQDDQLKDPMHRVYRVASVSEGVDLGEDYELEFRPLWQLSDDEMSQIEERGTRSVLAVKEAGVISDKTTLMELKSRGTNTNSWQTITEEDIDDAEDEVIKPPGPGEVTGPDGHPMPAPVPEGGAAGAKPGAALKKEQGGKDRRPRDAHITVAHRQPTMNFQGLPIVVECPKGQRRWEGGPVMPAHYGYIASVGSAEGSQEWMDCMVGDDLNAQFAYVIDQHREGGEFDEHKVMLGFPDPRSAQIAYAAAYKGVPVRAAAIATQSIPRLREWMSAKHNQTKPVMAAA